MTMLVTTHYPNPAKGRFVPGVTTWVFLASDNSTYATMALLLAAGKKPYPSLDFGQRLGTCLLHTAASDGTAGSGCYYVRDMTTTPVDADAENTVGPFDQQVNVSCPFHCIAVRLFNATDILFVNGRW